MRHVEIGRGDGLLGLGKHDARHPPLPCRPSPPQGRILAAPSQPQILQCWRLAKPGKSADLPLAGEMPGRPEGGA
ncbi:hypothetical protein EJ078_16880 [Mesorhizobium sp. M1A.F.Ca.IN.022.06.1.1]|nr:hypothetical protein EJ078_16880 [Mesorhizobium sp. M1A.F.Ca.IN.022.06.1.1]